MLRPLKDIGHIAFYLLAADDVEEKLDDFIRSDKEEWDWSDEQQIRLLHRNILLFITRAYDNHQFFSATLALHDIYRHLIDEKRENLVIELMGDTLLCTILDEWSERKADIIDSFRPRELMFFSVLLKFNIFTVPQLQPYCLKIAHSLLEFVNFRGNIEQRLGRGKLDAIKRLFTAFNEDVRHMYLEVNDAMEQDDLLDLQIHFEAQIDFFGTFSESQRWISSALAVARLLKNIPPAGSARRRETRQTRSSTATTMDNPLPRGASVDASTTTRF